MIEETLLSHVPRTLDSAFEVEAEDNIFLTKGNLSMSQWTHSEASLT